MYVGHSSLQLYVMAFSRASNAQFYHSRHNVIRMLVHFKAASSQAIRIKPCHIIFWLWEQPSLRRLSVWILEAWLLAVLRRRTTGLFLGLCAY